ncbi:DUF6647 family protein [Mesorhizobium sp.]|uniref:DUF6647 family protein n=1 Tax=Mesorhizobium sp. TaxID=1871066 RepID=UPI00257A76CA|nr:DUF6647 family protein [Mesorhizobium sp.]
MNTSVLKCIAVGFCFATTAPVAAAEMQNTKPLLNAVELWLVANFRLPPATALPRVVTVPSPKLVEMRYGPGSQVAEGEVMAAYDEASRTIYVTDGWTSRSPADLSVLVHEMVHHLQASAEMRFACPAEREVLAYRAQDAWLQLFGSDLESAFDMDPAMLLVATVCAH